MAETSLYGQVVSDKYLMRRLRDARRAPIPPSRQIDLAMSDLDDDALDEALSEFGATERERYGVSDLLNELLSREPRASP